MNLTKWITIIFFSAITHMGFAQNTSHPITEKQKIDYLIQRVENLQNAQFIRNGISYNAKTASAHLRMKLEKAGNRIKTANDFIERIASQSSTTGNPYKIVFENGKEVLAKDFYMQCLKELEPGKK